MTILLHTHTCGAAPCASPHHKYIFSLSIPPSFSGTLDPNHFPPGPGSDVSPGEISFSLRKNTLTSRAFPSEEQGLSLRIPSLVAHVAQSARGHHQPQLTHSPPGVSSSIFFPIVAYWAFFQLLWSLLKSHREKTSWAAFCPSQVIRSRLQWAGAVGQAAGEGIQGEELCSQLTGHWSPSSVPPEWLRSGVAGKKGLSKTGQ